MILLACDHISEDERLIYEKPEPAQRVVLIEDFTGQRCSNCPKATEVIEQLQETYGDAIVAVGIHGGPLGFAGNAKNIGLATETGDAYYNHWGLEYQPIGLVNRHAPVNYPEWAAAVKEELAKPAPLRLDGIVTTEGDVMTIRLWADGTDGNVTGKLHSSDPGAIRELMLEQVTQTTNWAADVESAKALGCTRFVEFGPGKVLSGLIKKIDAALTVTNVSDLATLDATVSALG